jgi:xanthine dehydrogenase accessory factor
MFDPHASAALPLSAAVFPAVEDEDHAALAATAIPGTALCTIVGIEGSFSRRLGAQLAIAPDGRIVGSLADGCLERQLAADCRNVTQPTVQRYGRGSANIDFRLPCGGGLDILIDPAPDAASCTAVLDAVRSRRPATLALPGDGQLAARPYLPALRVHAFGAGPEIDALEAIAATAGIACFARRPDQLTLGQPAGPPLADRWTACVILFHDHEWDFALLRGALASPAFYVGAQGGRTARDLRIAALREAGVDDADIARIRSPIGMPGGSRAPHALALAILAEIAGEYERLRDRP